MGRGHEYRGVEREEAVKRDVDSFSKTQQPTLC